MRYAQIDPEDLTADQRELYQMVVDGPRSATQTTPIDSRGRLRGPFQAMLAAPGIGKVIQEVGEFLRFKGSLPGRLRELAICVVANELDCSYEWRVHEQFARQEGATAEQLDCIQSGHPIPDLTVGEREGLRLCYALVRRTDVADELFSAVANALGIEQTIEIAYLVGYYAMLDGILRTTALG